MSEFRKTGKMEKGGEGKRREGRKWEKRKGKKS